MRSGLLLGVALLLTGCVAGPRVVSAQRLEELSLRTYASPFDEVYDATWLSAERLGYQVVESDRRLGTFTAQHASGHTWSVAVSPRDSQQWVTAVPGPAQAAWQLDGEGGEVARWDALETRTRALLEAWRAQPEWTFTPASNDVGLEGFHVRVPRDWEHVDLAVDRHHVVVQKHKPPFRGTNPTLLIHLDRRRPTHPRAPLVLETAGLALEARTRLQRPSSLDATLTALGYGGDTALVDGPTERPVRWALWDTRTPEWTIRIVAVCGQDGSGAECDREWRALVGSIVSRGFEFPRTE